MIQLICIDTVWKVSDHGAFDWSTSRWPHRCCEKFQDLAPWWPRISMSWAKRRGYCSHGICSIRFLFFALNEGCFLGYTEDCSEIIKEKSKSLLTLVEKTAHAARDIRRKTSAGTCCRTKNLKKNVRQATSHLKLGIRQLRDQLRLLDDTDTGEENLPWN